MLIKNQAPILLAIVDGSSLALIDVYPLDHYNNAASRYYFPYLPDREVSQRG